MRAALADLGLLASSVDEFAVVLNDLTAEKINDILNAEENETNVKRPLAHRLFARFDSFLRNMCAHLWTSRDAQDLRNHADPHLCSICCCLQSLSFKANHRTEMMSRRKHLQIRDDSLIAFEEVVLVFVELRLPSEVRKHSPVNARTTALPVRTSRVLVASAIPFA